MPKQSSPPVWEKLVVEALEEADGHALETIATRLLDLLARAEVRLSGEMKGRKPAKEMHFEIDLGPPTPERKEHDWFHLTPEDLSKLERDVCTPPHMALPAMQLSESIPPQTPAKKRKSRCTSITPTKSKPLKSSRSTTPMKTAPNKNTRKSAVQSATTKAAPSKSPTLTRTMPVKSNTSSHSSNKPLSRKDATVTSRIPAPQKPSPQKSSSSKLRSRSSVQPGASKQIRKSGVHPSTASHLVTPGKEGVRDCTSNRTGQPSSRHQPSSPPKRAALFAEPKTPPRSRSPRHQLSPPKRPALCVEQKTPPRSRSPVRSGIPVRRKYRNELTFKESAEVARSLITTSKQRPHLGVIATDNAVEEVRTAERLRMARKLLAK
eukprot:gb/GEZN01006177.1/.p1 GENE.gb/GEZN01006177.1/~~gb/GEZN01006177.1/.p1  ORF type:complete len:378 (-),score=44.74 gb/GEZN01006177.1/:497-1630(-)